MGLVFELLYRSTDDDIFELFLRWEHNQWYTLWGSASYRWVDWPTAVVLSPSRR